MTPVWHLGSGRPAAARLRAATIFRTAAMRRVAPTSSGVARTAAAARIATPRNRVA
eukprot:CAMPEP_0117577930 /NCGR_PEP_ID=MMETSP0784-20121206/63697_1 /TAXON_ID=39447 /ORGANISM="" /LENGTH=55 /DNA_ID=CAMNT_0005377489 /DNA_START=17 /DNA_END=181 /DNA_ORIENTATION=+